MSHLMLATWPVVFVISVKIAVACRGTAGNPALQYAAQKSELRKNSFY